MKRCNSTSNSGKTVTQFIVNDELKVTDGTDACSACCIYTEVQDLERNYFVSQCRRENIGKTFTKYSHTLNCDTVTHPAKEVRMEKHK